MNSNSITIDKYHYKNTNWHADSLRELSCRLEIWKDENMVIVYHTGSTPSAQQMSESVAMQVCDEHHIKPKNLIWIDYYNDDSYSSSTMMNGDVYHLVKFELENDSFTKEPIFSNGRFVHISKETIQAFLDGHINMHSVDKGAWLKIWE